MPPSSSILSARCCLPEATRKALHQDYHSGRVTNFFNGRIDSPMVISLAPKGGVLVKYDFGRNISATMESYNAYEHFAKTFVDISAPGRR